MKQTAVNVDYPTTSVSIPISDVKERRLRAEMEAVCWKCGNITKIEPDPNVGLPALYEEFHKCPKCGVRLFLGHRIKEVEG